MIVYNTDETTDESNTYRFTCYVSLNNWDWTLENMTILHANNKGTDQPAHPHSLVTVQHPHGLVSATTIR